MPPRLSQQLRLKFVEALADPTATNASIARRLSVDPRTVALWRRRNEDGAAHTDLPRSGRHRKTSSSKDKHLFKEVRLHPTRSSSEYNTLWKAGVGARTVRPRLQEHSFKSRRPELKPPLSEKQRRDRHRWAMEHK